MKKLILSFSLLLSFVSAHSQNLTFEKGGDWIGQSLSPPAQVSRCMMSEIEKIGSTWYLYFTVESPTSPGMILYATSSDLSSWTIGDTVLQGVNDTTDRTFILGGARVIPVSGGQYRMFYRCAQKYTTPNEPKYHIRTAISSDGMNFTEEGIAIEINSYDPSSYFTHVGHSEFYYDAGGNLRALLTGMDTTMATGPDKIYTAQSADEGLTWTNFTPLYSSSHDPVVIQDSSGTFHTFFTYLNTAFHTASSPDGVGWPSSPDTLWMLEAGDTLTESTDPVKLADLGAVVDESGTIIITSNYSTVALGPWTEIAWFTQTPTSVKEPFSGSLPALNCYPNPSEGWLNIEIVQHAHETNFVIRNVSGQIVEEGVLNPGNNHLDMTSLAPGLYFIHAEGFRPSKFVRQ